ncbi:MAG: LptA/OstA family protein [Nitrospiria bacterium]
MLKHWSNRKGRPYIWALPVFIWASFFCWANFFEANPVFADAAVSNKLSGPVSIHSEKMVLQNLENKIVFEGNVEILNQGLSIKSERAEVFLKRSEQSLTLLPGQKGDQQVSRIIAYDNVRIQRGSQHAVAEKGVYDREKEVIVLTGNPQVWEEGYQVKGKVITFFIKEERTLVAESEVLIHNDSAVADLRKK